MERIAIAMQDGGARAGARHEGAARATRPTSFCLAAEPLNGPPGRGDFAGIAAISRLGAPRAQSALRDQPERAHEQTAAKAPLLRYRELSPERFKSFWQD